MITTLFKGKEKNPNLKEKTGVAKDIEKSPKN